MGALALCRTVTCVNSPEVRSVLYGWITLILTSVIGGVGWWIKRVSDNRAARQKEAAANEPARDEIFTKQMEILINDFHRQIAGRDAEIVTLRAENDKLRQGGTQRRTTDKQEGPG